MDFDSLPIANEYYDGAAKKYSVKYNDNIYMVKYPAKTNIKNDLQTEYSNSSFSEYISCHIINALKIPDVSAQETILGTSKGKIVVACKDFTNSNQRLVKFNMIQNADIDSDMSGRHPVLESVLQTYHSLPELKNNPSFLQRFWDTFALDTLLGNFDRHSGNWGFLNDSQAGTMILAPIYDCGSCLYPALSERAMRDILSSKSEIDKRIFVFPQSAFLNKRTKQKIKYHEFYNQTSDLQAKAALVKIADSVNFATINSVLEQTPYLSDIQKEFYETMIHTRYTKLIEPHVLKKQISIENPIQEYCQKYYSNKTIERKNIKELERED